MSIELKRINTHVIKRVKARGEVEDTRPIKGADIIPGLYCVMFLVAKKNSGKTTVIGNLLKSCVGRDTKVIVFSSTLNNDPTWNAIRELLEDRNIDFTGHTSIYDDTGGNRIRTWISEQKELAAAGDQKESAEVAFEDQPVDDARSLLKPRVEPADQQPKPKKRKKSKYRAPETFFVFDDLSGELRDPAVAELVKVMRHHHTKIILSSQYLKDITPATAQNVDIWMLFNGLSEEYIKRVHELGSPSINLKDFLTLYKHATSKPYSFLYVNVTSNAEYRQRFDLKYSI